MLCIDNMYNKSCVEQNECHELHLYRNNDALMMLSRFVVVHFRFVIKLLNETVTYFSHHTIKKSYVLDFV